MVNFWNYYIDKLSNINKDNYKNQLIIDRVYPHYSECKFITYDEKEKPHDIAQKIKEWYT